jgi:hypothetical protein
VRRHLGDIFFSIFAWTEGSFQAAAGEPLVERIRLAKHTVALVLEGVRRKYSQAMLDAVTGGPQALVNASRSDVVKSMQTLADLSGAERRALAMFNGDNSIDDIAEKCDLDRMTASHLAAVLVALGDPSVVDRGGRRHEESQGYLVGESDLNIDRQRILAKFSLVEDADYFALLGVRDDATRFEIKRAYEDASRYFLPENFPVELREELGDEIGEICEVLEEAYRVLRDDSLRAQYRSHLLPRG